MRTTPYIGIAAAIIFGLIVVLGNLSVPHNPNPAESSPTKETATSSVAVIPALGGGTIKLENTTSTSSPQQVQAPAKTEPQQTQTPTETAPREPSVTQKTESTTPIQPAATAAPETSTPFSFDAAASTLRGALVNVICYAPAGSGIRSSSGSGVVIDPRGIILTNAHVAAPFLLKNKGVSCTIRTGSPAHDAYTAHLMFISPTWVSKNAASFAAATPTGTGEYDYALLAITGSATSVDKPSFFSAVPLAQTEPTPGEGVAIASYAAQFLDSSQIQSALFPTVVFGSIKDIYTFATNSIDVIALGGSVAAQEGSSGGGVVNQSGQLVATITTSTVTGDTSSRNVNAITASYIRRAYQSETGSTLSSLVSQNPTAAVEAFASQIPGLEATILATLSH